MTRASGVARNRSIPHASRPAWRLQLVADMNAPFPSRFAFATHPIVSRGVAAQPATAKGLSIRAAILGLSVLAIAAASALVAG